MDIYNENAEKSHSNAPPWPLQAYSAQAFAEEVEQDTETMVVHGTAEEALKQQPGVSIITAEDIAKDPRLTISQKSSVKCPAST
jgi:outer membrane receptor for ferrienterochelin and colicin